jgi:hypothetical protein
MSRSVKLSAYAIMIFGVFATGFIFGQISLRQVPSRSDLEENDAEFGTTEEIPPEDAALSLFYALRSMHSGQEWPRDYADAIQDYMILRSPAKAREVYKRAVERGMVTSVVKATANSWGIHSPHN